MPQKVPRSGGKRRYSWDVTNPFKVEPCAELFPLHPVHMLAVSVDGCVCAASREGELMLLTPELEPMQNISVGRSIRSIGISRGAAYLAVCGEASCDLLDMNRQALVWESEFPLIAASFDAKERLWAVRRCSQEQVRLYCYDVNGNEILAPRDLDDPQWESDWSFYPHSRPGNLLLWAAAGQDGQSTFVVGGSEQIECKMLGIADTPPPSVHASREEFIVCDIEFLKMSYPEAELLGSIALGEESEGFAHLAEYLSEDFAIASVREGMLVLVDLREMKVVAPLHIAGQEPRPTCEFYPSLANDTELTGNLFDLRPQGKGYFLSCHSILPEPEVGRRQLLLRFQVDGAKLNERYR